MKTMQKLQSLARFELNITMDNKLVLIYTLFFPVVFLIINTHRTSALYGYWAYIIVLGTLSGVITGLISMRENNFLKMFSYIAGSKKYLFFANLLSQMVIIEAELLVFNLVALVIMPGMSVLTILSCLATSVVLIPLCALALAFFLTFQVKMNTFSILSSVYLVLMLALANVQLPAIPEKLIWLINPFVYAANVFSSLSSLSGVTDWWILSAISLIYLCIGLKCVALMPIQARK